MAAFNSRAPRDNQNESAGFVTFTLENGQQLEGYVVLSAKNLARLGITEDQVPDLVGKKFSAKAEIRQKSEPTLATPVTFE